VQARSRIDFAAYVLTSVPVIEALTRAAGRGVKVRVYRDGRDARIPRRLGEAIDRLAAEPNVEIRYKGSPAPLMHLKAYLIDGRLLRTGAGNFSRSGLTAQDNDMIALDCASAIEAFQKAFERMWRR
jgi:phosphatidylserine/phosphatidylglycerophosphate/cardiolipin synthase-like enzyme